MLSENDIIAFATAFGPSAAIEIQETMGQSGFVNADTLPVRINGIEALTAAGVQLKGPVDGDPLFQHVILPDGWKKVATDHSMWSHLVDDRGRKWALIFYKAAFYDREAHMAVIPRYHLETKIGDNDRYIATVYDYDTPIWSSESRTYPAGGEFDVEIKEGRLWLDANFPHHQDPSAYRDGGRS